MYVCTLVASDPKGYLEASVLVIHLVLTVTNKLSYQLYFFTFNVHLDLHVLHGIF